MEYLAYIVLVVAGLIIALQLRVFLAARRRQGLPAPDYAAVLSPGQKNMPRLLFYFFSEQCGPCKAMTPHIDVLAGKYANVVKVDVRQQLELARAFGVMGTPTLVVVQDGIIQTMQVGGITPEKLEALLNPRTKA